MWLWTKIIEPWLAPICGIWLIMPDNEVNSPELWCQSNSRAIIQFWVKEWRIWSIISDIKPPIILEKSQTFSLYVKINYNIHYKIVSHLLYYKQVFHYLYAFQSFDTKNNSNQMFLIMSWRMGSYVVSKVS